jgi:hypothetical protein
MESNTFQLNSFKLGLVLDCQSKKLAKVDVEFKLEVWRWGIWLQEMACSSTRLHVIIIWMFILEFLNDL